MPIDYKPYGQRTPDMQYRELLRLILQKGERSTSAHREESICYMAPPPLRYDLRNGIPLITERSMKGIWKSSFAEIMAFLNGVRSQKELLEYGVNERFWGPFVTAEKCASFGLPEGDLGPGSYGPALGARQTSGQDLVNQMTRVLDQIKTAPHLRTHFLDPWIPEYCVPAPGQKRQVVVAPCHGWMHFRVINGRLNLHMFQRSADVPIGVPSNIFQYSALLLAVAHVLDMPAGWYYHSFSDAHIYYPSAKGNREENGQISQLEAVGIMLEREPRPFPTLEISRDAPRYPDLLAFRPEHLALSDYDPHPAIKGIEVAV